jgi:hypothetical protein
MALGSLEPAGRGLLFAPNAAIKRFAITTYRVIVRGRRIRLMRVAASSVARASGAVPVAKVRASMVVAVSARAFGREWRQQFVVPYGSAGRAGGRRDEPGLGSEALCDGTSGQILTPVFGGPHAVPLAVAVRGPGRVAVSVARVGGGAFYRRVVVARRRTVDVSFAALAGRRLPRGAYRITVTAVHSRLPEPVQLTALAV